MKRLFALVSAVVFCVSCLISREHSPRQFVADRAADWVAQESRYERRCVAVKGPPDCAAFKSDLIEARLRIDEATKTLDKLRALPDAQRKALSQSVEKLRSYQ